MLPSVLEFNAPEADALYAELAEVVIGAPVAGSAEAKTAALIAALRQLIDDVALPATLQQAGVKATRPGNAGGGRHAATAPAGEQSARCHLRGRVGDLPGGVRSSRMSKPAPPARADYKVFYPISTRWSDNDIYGHVNNVTYYSYFDTAANRYLIEEGGLDISDGSDRRLRGELGLRIPLTHHLSRTR